MKFAEYWPKLLFIEAIIVFISLFAVNLIFDFSSFVIDPVTNPPHPYFPQIFEVNDPTDTIFVKRYWTQILFFLLVFFGQIAIFRQRRRIFTIKTRQDG